MILAIWGEEKSLKTTLALSFPKPIYHLDLDVGGYERAAWRVDTTGITSKSFPTPLQIEKLMGATPEEIAGKITIKIPKKVVGMRELWQTVMQDYINALQKPDTEVATIIMDSATQLWSICHTALLQEKQEKQIVQGVPEKDIRESLKSIEYGPANDKMKSVVFSAKSFKKHLVLTHYPRDVYADKLTEKGIEQYKTGKVDVDGFNQTKRLSDLVIYTTAENTAEGLQFIGEITLSGLIKTLEGQRISNPTYEKIKKAIDMARGVTA